MAYVDGFVIPIPKRNVAAYRRLAAKAGKLWMEHGAVDYKECVGDDLKVKGVITFPRLARSRPGETVVFSWITYKSRAHRDRVNAKVMKDKRIAAMMDGKKNPFDMKRLTYGGFKVLVNLALLLAVLAAPAAAQSAPPADAGVATSRALWTQVTAQVTEIAKEVPDSLYGWKPTPTVRSFGELFGHIAGAQYMFCAAALGEPAREEDAVEKAATTKAALVEALEASTAYCAPAYRQSDASAMAGITMFGQQQTRLWALGMNALHNGEHYGNLVTYLRINGIVPPASRRQ
jgi:uncharacterized protein YbaA (DUF1428 family)/uncharacterized damage-inducible protein DinB